MWWPPAQLVRVVVHCHELIAACYKLKYTVRIPYPTFYVDVYRILSSSEIYGHLILLFIGENDFTQVPQKITSNIDYISESIHGSALVQLNSWLGH